MHELKNNYDKDSGYVGEDDDDDGGYYYYYYYYFYK